MSILRALILPITRRFVASQTDSNHVAMPMARTPRDLDEARKKRNSRNRKSFPNLFKNKTSRRIFVKRSSPMKSLKVTFFLEKIGWRIVSFGIVGLCVLSLGYITTQEKFFVDSIELVSTEYVPGDEIYRQSGVHGMNIFWIDPVLVRHNISNIPGIDDAMVEFEWPSTLYIQVIERDPVVVWQQGGESVWVDQYGEIFPARKNLEWLLPIVVEDESNTIDVNKKIPSDVIEGAMQLKALRPNIEMLHYDVGRGLSYQDGRNWRGYFGTGNNMATKLLVYETLVEDLMMRGVWPKIVSVVEPSTPFHRE